MNIPEKTILFCADILERMKKENEKRNVLYEHGVDLCNYQNDYFTCAIDSVEFMLSGWKDEIEWWLFESVEKRYWLDKVEHNVEKAEDFIRFNLSLREENNA